MGSKQILSHLCSPVTVGVFLVRYTTLNTIPMPLRRPDLLKTDASDRERAVLEYVLKREASTVTNPVPKVSVKEARQGALQVASTSDRDTTRLLFISRDTSLLNQTTQSLDGYLNLADVFDEVHIVVLQPGIKAHNPVLRVSPNVWLYVVTATHWWWTPVAAITMIESQLMFAEGFRPDLVVARDPYESALVAYYIGRHFNRPTQLHILENFTNQRVRATLSHRGWRACLARYVIPKFASIRTSTDQIAALVAKRYPTVLDIATLPRFHNYQAANANAVALTLKDKYQQFTFMIVYLGVLDSESRAYQAMDAVRGLLRNKKIGFVICGEGGARAELQKRAQLLGIAEQVVFERAPSNAVAYLAAVDVLIVPDTTSASDEVAVLGAFAGVPLVLATTPQRADLFVHGESALLSAADNVAALGAHVNQIVNDVALRQILATAAYDTVSTRLHEDPVAYRLAYRDSVEAAMFARETTESDREESDISDVLLVADAV